MSETIGATAVVIGLLFDLVGCIGLLRFPDVYNRLQAATKCVTLGTCLIIVGAILTVGSGSGVAKGLACLAFILVTSPTAAHALARASHVSGVDLWEGSVVDLYRRDEESRVEGGAGK